MLLSYEISRKLSGEVCFVHQMGISAAMSDDVAVVKVCCSYFKDDMEKQLKKHFSTEFAAGKIRLQLPGLNMKEAVSEEQSSDVPSDSSAVGE
jgi:hypothetical protein